MVNTQNPLHILRECAQQTYTLIALSAASTGESDLVGWCAKASLHLFESLKNRGLSPKLKVWQSGELGHSYVECDNYIIDVTASQFGGQNIEIVRLGRGLKRQYWSARKTFLDPNLFIAYLRKNKWHVESIPTLQN